MPSGVPVDPRHAASCDPSLRQLYLALGPRVRVGMTAARPFHL